ncbi:endolytic transglycosylase MltG [Pontibacter sp. BT310]|uniref:Endolytic murein transglycosylase n=1 Tax=Pontibacter populi TaxID=890055 RepID=A0ABS6X9D0_9BACT|nr:MULTISPECIES: endolytic transglycosylase MltG [Pontibacter]MBJ6116843.1 endolytic transglycosylase MltG [Pontibacter sp. BT310]MBR0569265.1 endolytic transglycosylase MltG [Microvirga sp. STS03]MBW3363696.1 endolytic transglycosylase MltG [Pontibacter populi]
MAKKVTTTKRKKKEKSKVIPALSVLFVLLFVSFSYYAYQIVYTTNVDTKDQDTYVYIPTGATYEQAMDSVEASGVIIDPLSLRFMAKLMDYDELVKPGRYKLESGWGNRQLIGVLRTGQQTPVKLTFTNVRLRNQLAEKLAAEVEPSEEEIDALLSDPEYLGTLDFDTTNVVSMFIPNTYEVYWTITAKELMERMKSEYDKFWTEERLEKAEKLNLTQQQVSTLASIVQAETIKNDEKPRVAGVYLNRLEKGMLLQADPTVVFGVGDFSIRRVLNVHLRHDSPYNTYRYKGLPPGPINVPNISSIDAVLNPEKHDYIYFCAKEDFSGYHSFAVTVAEHQANARRYQKALNERRILK